MIKEGVIRDGLTPPDPNQAGGDSLDDHVDKRLSEAVVKKASQLAAKDKAAGESFSRPLEK